MFRNVKFDPNLETTSEPTKPSISDPKGKQSPEPEIEYHKYVPGEGSHKVEPHHKSFDKGLLRTPRQAEKAREYLRSVAGYYKPQEFENHIHNINTFEDGHLILSKPNGALFDHRGDLLHHPKMDKSDVLKIDKSRSAPRLRVRYPIWSLVKAGQESPKGPIPTKQREAYNFDSTSHITYRGASRGILPPRDQ